MEENTGKQMTEIPNDYFFVAKEVPDDYNKNCKYWCFFGAKEVPNGDDRIFK